jgi:hypothetical protein
MRTKITVALAIFAAGAFIGSAPAQDLGPQLKKLADGVFVHAGRGFESGAGIILIRSGDQRHNCHGALTNGNGQYGRRSRGRRW